MKKQLKNPPLTYMLAQVNISTITAIGSFVPQLQEAMRANFPEYKLTNIPIESPGRTVIIQQWHFLDREASTGILFDSNTIIVHTSKYKSFLNIIEIIKNVLDKFNHELGISFYKRLGLRYINVIQNNIDAYVKEELLGFPLPVNTAQIQVNKFLAKTEKIQELTSGSTIKLQSTYVGKDVLRQDLNNLVPIDLTQTAAVLSFPQEKQPKDSFLILDIDHFIEMRTPPYDSFIVDDIITKFIKLHEIIDKVFFSAITKKAIQDWS